MSLDVTLQTPEGITGDHNITHNLKEMAIAAGFGQELWRQEETDIHFASDLIEILAVGVIRLESRPLHYDQFNAKNGWGMREDLIRFTKDLLRDCLYSPDAEILTHR
jgi:hypothetical protein